MKKNTTSSNTADVFTPSNIAVVEELEILEKFLKDSTEFQIREAAKYIANRAYMNLGKIKSTPDSHLKSRFINIADKVSKYLTG